MQQKIIKAIAKSTQPVSLITAYEISGSSPCQSGSMLAVFEDGSMIGTVGGGNVETKAIELAKTCLKEQKSDLLKIDMLGKSAESNEMICGGTVKLWIEYINNVSHFKVIAENIEQGHEVVRIGKICINGNTIAVINSKKELLSSDIDNLDIDLNVTSLHQNFISKNELFYQFIIPSETLLIVGGGHVGKALAYHADKLGFKTTIADFREEFVEPSRYPENINCLKGDLPTVISESKLGAASYVVIVSPSHLMDLECAKALMTKEYRYAGLMGSRRKVKMIFEELKKCGFSDEKITTLNAPIGLDIGAISPDEIAISILAEIIAVKRNSSNIELFDKMKQAKRQKV